MKDYDIVICPTFEGNQPAITNLTGHPALCMPTGFSNQEISAGVKASLPTSITLLANLYQEALLLAVGKAFQQATDYEDKHPSLFK